MKAYKRIIACILMAGIVSSSLAGCGTDSDDGSHDNITLDEPVGVTADYDFATRRDMYEVEIYPTSVNPVVTEYSFAEGQTFASYGITPGGKVNPGDVLVYSETKSLDEQIETMKEQLEDSESEHAISVDFLKKDIQDAKDNEFKAFEPFAEVLKYQPDENSDAYAFWAQGALMPEGNYKRAVANRERLEENLRQSEELYNLEHEYKLGNLERIQKKKLQATISSDVVGEVVACNLYSDGDYIEKENSVVAVGDMTRRVLKTEYISKGNISKALDVYAIIDGKRYELEYVVMEPEEYKQKNEAGENVNTTFNLVDPAGEVQIGTYAVVIMEKDKRSDVLCVPNDAVKKEADGYYVYLYDGTETNYVPVVTGMKDGMYTEILSGLNEGDMVLSSLAAKKGNKTEQVKRGEYSVESKYDGYLFYPFSEIIKNPVKYGEAYLKEVLVTSNQMVEKDQVLATLEVFPDQIEIDRLNRQIMRLQSRLEKMKQEKAEKDGKNIKDRGLERSIADNEKTTAKCLKELKKISQYSGIVEIKAPYPGIVYPNDSIKPGGLLTQDTGIVEIADVTRNYIIVKDDKNQLNYGNEAEIVVTSSNGASTINGRVVSVNAMSLSRDLTNEYALIAVDQESMASLAGSTMVEGGRWDRNSFKVTVNVRSEKDVLIVPKMAVTLKDKSTYVTVVKEDGSVENVSFIPGGSDANYYWIVDGLTEGMTVCWE